MRKFIRKHLPHPDALREQRILRIFAPSLLHPRLWHLNRHSASGGIAAGLFCSLIPGPLQMAGAAILCMIFRVNLPLALLATLVSNPFTIIPLYILAIGIGELLTGSKTSMVAPPAFHWQSPGELIADWSSWFASLGYPLLTGLPILAALMAAAGFVLTRLIWSYWLRRHWRLRSARHQKNIHPNQHANDNHSH